MRRSAKNLSILLLLAASAWARVLVRWTEATLPEQKALGVQAIVIPWSSEAAARAGQARARGYRIYFEANLQQAEVAGAEASKQAIAGLIVDREKPDQPQAGELASKLRASHSQLEVLVADLEGKQPQMRGQTVTSRNGVLQVSSPTAQPWLDSNLALVRFDEEFNPKQVPLYTFAWEADDSVRMASGPAAEDYALAVAEANGLRADLILNVDNGMQKGLATGDRAAWDKWNKVKPWLTLAAGPAGRTARAWVNVGVVTQDFDTAYEPMNLMGRHNIPYRVIRAKNLNEAALEGLDAVAVFAAPDDPSVEALAAFAKRGGTAVIVDAKGNYPWHSEQGVQSAEHAVTYSLGSGKVIELGEPVGDPETFAQDVRRLIPKDKALIGAWNALTTITLAYRQGNDTVVELVNYAQEPLKIQLRLKGAYGSAVYELPGQAGKALTKSQRDGFTEMVVPGLEIAGRVRLRSGEVKTSARSKN
jgi:hypothetical protein